MTSFSQKHQPNEGRPRPLVEKRPKRTNVKNIRRSSEAQREGSSLNFIYTYFYFAKLKIEVNVHLARDIFRDSGEVIVSCLVCCLSKENQAIFIRSRSLLIPQWGNLRFLYINLTLKEGVFLCN